MRLRLLIALATLLVVAGCAPAAGRDPASPAAPPPAMVTPAPGPGPAEAPAPEKPAPAATQPAQPQPTTTIAQPTNTQPATAQPAKPQPAKAEPAKADPAKTQPPKPGPAQAQPPKAPTPRLAILNYHDVDETASGGFTVSQAQFDAHVSMLKEEGYTFYRLEDVERLLAGVTGMPEKGVMLAFDDGYQSFTSRVLPVARKYNIPAVCFVVTKYMDFDIIFGRPHMSTMEMKQAVDSGLLELAGHSYDGHRTSETEDGTQKPVLTHRIRIPQSSLYETPEQYARRVRNDFDQTAKVLKGVNASTGLRHFTFPYTARTDEAVRLGMQAGFRYFYVGGDQLVTPDTDPTAIPRVHAGAPDISAEVLRERLRKLFAQP